MKETKVLEIHSVTLARAELHSVEVSCSARDEDVYQFLSEVHTDECVHSWKNLFIDQVPGALEKLYTFENGKRTTDFFFYYGNTKAGGRELIAIGTVAHKLAHGFAHEGYPVIARCYIKPKYRNFRLYFPILKHRFDYCLRFFGDRLRGIHLGTQNPRVYSMIRKNFFGIQFCYLGDEYLRQNETHQRVHDYLWLSPQTKKELLRVRGKAFQSENFHWLMETIEDLVQNRFKSTGFLKLHQLMKETERETGWSPFENLALRQIVDLMEAIPVIKEENGAVELETNIVKRTG